MKNIVKAIIAVTASALLLTGCGEEKEQALGVGESVIEGSSSVTSEVEKTIPSESVTVVATPTTSTAPVENNPTETSTTSSTSSSNVATSSTTTSSKPVESKPVESKPVEVHNHSFTEATCEKPATCTTCGETKGNALGHKYNEGVCTICGKNDPNYVAVHNCKKDGHIWGESYTKTYTEDFELKESHDVYANGFDVTLAERYCNLETIPSFSSIFGMAYGSGSTPIKTTATRTVTDYYHKCSECGASEKYDTDEDVTTSDNWVIGSSSPALKTMCQTIWWDIYNIPDEVWEWVEQNKRDKEDFFNNL